VSLCKKNTRYQAEFLVDFGVFAKNYTTGNKKGNSIASGVVTVNQTELFD
jgi:hypothetical protein